jgi:hypothetical protein
LCEFGPGVSVDNPILRNENYTFALDGLPMLLALVLLNAVHPGTVLRGPYSEFPRLTRKERKAIKQEKKDAKRATKEEKRGAGERKKGRFAEGDFEMGSSRDGVGRGGEDSV